VADVLREVASRGVLVKVLMMSDNRLGQGDLAKRDESIRKMRGSLGNSVEVKLADEVIIRGCIVDPDSEGKALFLVEEVGVPFILREAAITSHPGVVKGLASMFDMIWRFNSKSPD